MPPDSCTIFISKKFRRTPVIKRDRNEINNKPYKNTVKASEEYKPVTENKAQSYYCILMNARRVKVRSARPRPQFATYGQEICMLCYRRSPINTFHIEAAVDQAD